MKTATYPQIGSSVEYVRQDKTGAVVTGNAVVYGLMLDPNNRLMAHLKDPVTDDRFNVHVACLEPTSEFIAKLNTAIVAIKATGDEGNGKVQAIVSEYNLNVENQYTAIFGDPLVLDA